MIKYSSFTCAPLNTLPAISFWKSIRHFSKITGSSQPQYALIIARESMSIPENANRARLSYGEANDGGSWLNKGSACITSCRCSKPICSAVAASGMLFRVLAKGSPAQFCRLQYSGCSGSKASAISSLKIAIKVSTGRSCRWVYT
ncbi:hypothetical protein D3C86_1176190 [compost metagenome]